MNPHGRMATDPQGASIFGQDLLCTSSNCGFALPKRTKKTYHRIIISKVQIALKVVEGHPQHYKVVLLDTIV